MANPPNPNRQVIVNTDPRGMYHEVDCKRFIGAAKKGSLSNPDRYRVMRITEVPRRQATVLDLQGLIPVRQARPAREPLRALQAASSPVGIVVTSRPRPSPAPSPTGEAAAWLADLRELASKGAEPLHRAIGGGVSDHLARSLHV
jgi:hypothetical protein